jgi:hypothetical protein
MPENSPDRPSPVSRKDYSDAFEIGVEKGEGKESKQKRAHSLALDIRKFEIELYWKRAGYFWTFIAATLAGFMVVVQKEPSAKAEYLSIILGCVGLVFSFAWYCVNKGSKQWQENWENHVDLLENELVGPLYKIVTYRPKIKLSFRKPKTYYDWLKALVTGPSAFSVSKINQIVSLFVVGLWVALLFHVLPPFTWDTKTIEWKYFVPIGLAIFACLLIFAWGRTDSENYKDIQVKRRSTTIKEKNG